MTVQDFDTVRCRGCRRWWTAVDGDLSPLGYRARRVARRLGMRRWASVRPGNRCPHCGSEDLTRSASVAFPVAPATPPSPRQEQA